MWSSESGLGRSFKGRVCLSEYRTRGQFTVMPEREKGRKKSHPVTCWVVYKRKRQSAWRRPDFWPWTKWHWATGLFCLPFLQINPFAQETVAIFYISEPKEPGAVLSSCWHVESNMNIFESLNFPLVCDLLYSLTMLYKCINLTNLFWWLSLNPKCKKNKKKNWFKLRF